MINLKERQPQPPPSLIQRCMGKFNYTQKFVFIFFIAISLSLTLLTFITINELSAIWKTRQELQGLQYINKLQEIEGLIAEHNLISATFVPADSMGKYQLSDLHRQLSHAFDDFLLFDKQTAGVLKTDNERFALLEIVSLLPQSLKQEWDKILQQPTGENLNEDHELLLEKINSLITYVRDSSLLTFDPTIELHYLGDIAFRSMPESQLNIISLLNSNLTANSYDLAFHNSLIKHEAEEINTTLNKLFIKDQNVDSEYGSRQRLNLPLKSYNASISDLLKQSTVFSQQTEGSDPATLEFNSTIAQASKANFSLWKAVSNEVDLLLKNRISTTSTRAYMTLAFAFITILLAASIGFLVLKETNLFFRNIFEAVNSFASGDLSARASDIVYDTALEKIRKTLNELGDRIENVINLLQKSCVDLTTSTMQIAAAAKHQEGTVFQQEVTVKQILVTAGEISSTAKNFAITLNNVSKSAEETSSLAESGRESLFNMESTIQLMVDATGTIATKLATLNEKASAITSVITTITTVADRTNLLSLNAAIEAEKAGENGKSFGVIAREIRRLADQVANATLDIERMITEMMSSVSEGVTGVERFNEEIRRGVDQISTISERFSTIIKQVQFLTESFDNVNKGMKNQALGAEQINESILQLNDAAQQTTKSIRQFHSAIDQLTVSTKTMQSSVASMKK